MIFKVYISKIYFSLCDLDMQGTKTIWTIIKKDHGSSLVQIHPLVKEEIHFEAIVDDERPRWTSNDHISSPWANGSGELKNINFIYYIAKGFG